MTATTAITRAWRVGKYTVELSAPRPCLGGTLTLCCEWWPYMPRMPLPRRMRRQYERGREAALAEILEELHADALAQGLRLITDGPADAEPAWQTAGTLHLH